MEIDRVISYNIIHTAQQLCSESLVNDMSKYEPPWVFLQGDGSDDIQFSFDRIKEILGFDIDHAFLTYKKEASAYGYSVKQISMKEKCVRFQRITQTTNI